MQKLIPNATMFIGSFTGFGSEIAAKQCVFWSESIAYGRSNAGAVLLLHSTTAGSMTKSETKLHDSEICISHSITKTLHNDARLSLIGLRLHLSCSDLQIVEIIRTHHLFCSCIFS